MGIFKKKDDPLVAATIRSYSCLPDRPVVGVLRDEELWRIYRCVPEIHYAVTQQARLVGRLNWSVEADGEEVEDGDDLIRKAFGADLRGMIVLAAIHLQVVGRFYLVGVPRTTNRQWKILNSPFTADQKKIAESADVIVEVIIEDPAIPDLADSPVRAIRDLAAELILARAQSRSASRSRTAQTQLVLYPKEGAGPNANKFEKDLTHAIAEPLSDEKATSVAVPNIIGFPAEYIEKWKTLDISGPIDEKLHERVDRLIRQIAIGLDIAPSVLLGLEDSNQWSAYASLEDNWLGHVEPLAAPVGQAIAEALTMAANIDRDRIEVIPDPGPLLKRRPSVSDVIEAARSGIVTPQWAAKYLGAPESAFGTGAPINANTTTRDSSGDVQQLEQAEATREITGAPQEPRTAAITPSLDAARLADIDDQAYTSMEDLILDIAERVLEKLGAKIRSMAQGRDIDLPRDVSNVEIARQFQGDIPNADATINQVAVDAVAKVARVITRAQGRLRAMGVEVPPEPEEEGLTAAQAAFVTAVVATVAAEREGGTGIAQAWEAARQIVTIAGGGEGSDFRQAVSGIALAAATMRIIRRNFGLGPATGAEAYRWLHLYQGPDPHPVHLSLKDALFDGVSVFAGGFVAFPADHVGCQCIAVPARLVNVRTGWSQIQPTERS